MSITQSYAGLTFPEDILQVFINSTVKVLQQDEELLGELLQQKDSLSRDRIVNAITQQGVKVILGFPREQFVAPIVTITLASGEEDTVLADEMDIHFVKDLDNSAKLNTAILVAQPMPLTIALTGAVGTIPASGVAVIGDEYFTFNAGGNTSVTLVNRAILNSEPEVHAINDDFKLWVEEKIVGSYEQMSFRIDVLDDNADTAIFLSSLIRASLRANATYLHSKGLLSLIMSTTDWSQRPDHVPMHVFIRTIILNCKYELIMPGIPDPAITGSEVTDESPPIDGEQGGGDGNSILFGTGEAQ